jgi:hypothetical protein
LERSGSKFTFLALTLDDSHFSPGVVVVAVLIYCVCFTTVFCNCGILCVSSVGVIFCLIGAAFSFFLLLSGMLRATYRSRMSSSVSLFSSVLKNSSGSISGIFANLAGGAAGVGAI